MLLCLQAMEDHEAMCQHALGSDYVTLATVLEQMQANIRTDHNLNCGVRQGAFAAAPVRIPKACLPARQGGSAC